MTCGIGSHNYLIVQKLEKQIGIHWRLLNRYRKTRDAGYLGSDRYVRVAEECRDTLNTLLEIRKAGRK